MKTKSIIRNLLFVVAFIHLILCTVYSFIIFIPKLSDIDFLSVCMRMFSVAVPSAIIYIIWSGVSKENTLIPQLLMKLLTIPLLVCSVTHIYIQIDFIMNQGKFNPILAFLALMSCEVFRLLATIESGAIGIVSCINAKRKEILTNKQAVVYAILGFVPIADIVITIILTVKCRNKIKGTV